MKYFFVVMMMTLSFQAYAQGFKTREEAKHFTDIT